MIKQIKSGCLVFGKMSSIVKNNRLSLFLERNIFLNCIWYRNMDSEHKIETTSDYTEKHKKDCSMNNKGKQENDQVDTQVN